MPGGGWRRLRDWVASGMPGGVGIAAGAGAFGAGGPAVEDRVCGAELCGARARRWASTLPSEPVLFMKASSAWSGPLDVVLVPPGAEKLDYEVELAVILGKRAVHVEQTEVLNVMPVTGCSVTIVSGLIRKSTAGSG